MVINSVVEGATKSKKFCSVAKSTFGSKSKAINERSSSTNKFPNAPVPTLGSIHVTSSDGFTIEQNAR